MRRERHVVGGRLTMVTMLPRLVIVFRILEWLEIRYRARPSKQQMA